MIMLDTGNNIGAKAGPLHSLSVSYTAVYQYVK